MPEYAEIKRELKSWVQNQLNADPLVHLQFGIEVVLGAVGRHAQLQDSPYRRKEKVDFLSLTGQNVERYLRSVSWGRDYAREVLKLIVADIDVQNVPTIVPDLQNYVRTFRDPYRHMIVSPWILHDEGANVSNTAAMNNKEALALEGQPTVRYIIQDESDVVQSGSEFDFVMSTAVCKTSRDKPVAERYREL
jgi:hypothetical protein